MSRANRRLTLPRPSSSKNRNTFMAQEKTIIIIVNGTQHEWPKDEITYAEVVTLDVPDYSQHPEVTYSVKYTKGHGNKPDGILSPGASVKAKDGMIFSVSETGQS